MSNRILVLRNKWSTPTRARARARARAGLIDYGSVSGFDKSTRWPDATPLTPARIA